ncbi:PIN domain-containing protein [Candidatus Pacearchaeota archaeon]|nr:PIN domain-containing protein [Candidatus Pacearchaeota archaeon]
MGKITYFFDTYALFEIVHENKNYLPYTKNVTLIITKLNLMELHYRLLSLYGKNYAETAYNKFLEFSVEISDEVIKQANEFKSLNKKKRLSYVDCIGYVLAKISNAKFLTGDNQFKEMENVEFVK